MKACTTGCAAAQDSYRTDDMDIYGIYRPALEAVAARMAEAIEAYGAAEKEKTGEMLYEHLRYRLKSEESMEAKLRARGLPLTAESALRGVRDAVGFRIVCRFVDDIYDNLARIRALPGVTVAEEKDYIRHVKPNGYRSYHLILEVEAPYADPEGRTPGRFYVEVQLRTIAMDSWAALEHDMRYKHRVANPELIGRELKRCADELASCDLSMQTIRNLIRKQPKAGEGQL